jgi:hypothetical protein
MTISRAQQIDLSVTPYYHCVNGCVRRAFLCGVGKHTGISYEHRRGWISDKIKALSKTFAIDVAAYAVMSNHYHIVLRVDQNLAESWNASEWMPCSIIALVASSESKPPEIRDTAFRCFWACLIMG